ncbi:hypothetical protein GCM10009839_49770 [Catenulispora yoronensis]|uniref:Uncharacterized protein n=1 Tax=Catenulispora yoronensis TaxID=450799 RepID=A0ABN2UR71_9ACTN
MVCDAAGPAGAAEAAAGTTDRMVAAAVTAPAALRGSAHNRACRAEDLALMVGTDLSSRGRRAGRWAGGRQAGIAVAVHQGVGRGPGEGSGISCAACYEM